MKRQRWFKIKVESGWKPIDIVCRIFLSTADMNKHIKGLDGYEEGTPGACLAFIGKETLALNRLEVCLSAQWFSWMIASHEILHLAHRYVEYHKDDEFDTEEWLCIVHGYFFSVFKEKFDAIFCERTIKESKP